MTKLTMTGTLLALALTTVTAQTARADGWDCAVKSISERPTAVGGATAHGPAVTCANGRAIQLSTSNWALAARFASVFTAALLSGRTVYIDAGTCVHRTDCFAAAWELK